MTIASGVSYRTTLAEAVLIVDDDPTVGEFFHDALKKEGITAAIALSIADARRQYAELIAQGVQRLIILLDLMFDRYDPIEGMTFLRELARLNEFQRDLVTVIVLTGDDSQETRDAVLSDGAREFHVKGIDPAPVLTDILMYLGRDVRIATTRIEVLDVDDVTRDLEVRYVSANGAAFRCTVAGQFAPVEARVPGGSFWFDIYKSYTAGRIGYKAWCRTIDEEEERLALEKFLGP